MKKKVGDYSMTVDDLPLSEPHLFLNFVVEIVVKMSLMENSKDRRPEWERKVGEEERVECRSDRMRETGRQARKVRAVVGAHMLLVRLGTESACPIRSEARLDYHSLTRPVEGVVEGVG